MGRVQAAIGRATVRTDRFLARVRAKTFSLAASGAFASLRGRISTGGKTGTADREVFDYDRQGRPLVAYVDKDGGAHYKTEGWTDSWFIGFAPAEDPQIAFAVLVENGGQGAKAAAPVAARLVAKAASLGYIKSGASNR